MGVRITTQESVVAIYDSVSGFAFGKTFDSEEDAETFLRYLDENDVDARRLSESEFESAYCKALGIDTSPMDGVF